MGMDYGVRFIQSISIFSCVVNAIPLLFIWHLTIVFPIPIAKTHNREKDVPLPTNAKNPRPFFNDRGF